MSNKPREDDLIFAEPSPEFVDLLDREMPGWREYPAKFIGTYVNPPEEQLDDDDYAEN